MKKSRSLLVLKVFFAGISLFRQISTKRFNYESNFWDTDTGFLKPIKHSLHVWIWRQINAKSISFSV